MNHLNTYRRKSNTDLIDISKRGSRKIANDTGKLETKKKPSYAQFTRK